MWRTLTTSIVRDDSAAISYQDAGVFDIAYVLVKDTKQTWKGETVIFRLMKGSCSNLFGQIRSASIADNSAANEAVIQELQAQLNELENELYKITEVNTALAQQKIEEEKKVNELQQQVRYQKKEFQEAEDNLTRFRTECENKIRELRERSNEKIAKYTLKSEEYQQAIDALTSNEINTHYDEINSLDA